MMNLGYWGDGAVTAREAQVTLVRRMAERLPDLRGQRVLDAGCGAGGHSNVLALECGADVDAIDILPERIELGRDFAAAHGIGDRLRFQIADATALPFEDGSFDAVFSLEAAHSFSDKTRFAHEAFRVLRPGGSIALGDIIVTEAPLARRLSPPGPPLLTAEAWRRVMDDAGFELLEKRLIGAAVYPGNRRWLMLTAGERRKKILASLKPNLGVAARLGMRRGQAWLLEFAANRSLPTAIGALGLREYLLMVATRPGPR